MADSTKTHLPCPVCKHPSSKVSSGPADFMSKVHRQMGELKRRRECSMCGHKWSTIELPMDELQRLRGLAFRARMEDV